MKTKLLLACLIAVFCATQVNAQGFVNKLKQKADEAASKALEKKAKEKVGISDDTNNTGQTCVRGDIVVRRIGGECTHLRRQHLQYLPANSHIEIIQDLLHGEPCILQFPRRIGGAGGGYVFIEILRETCCARSGKYEKEYYFFHNHSGCAVLTSLLTFS